MGIVPCMKVTAVKILYICIAVSVNIFQISNKFLRSFDYISKSEGPLDIF